MVSAAIAAVRADPRVDDDQGAVWGLSVGAPLVSPLLREPPSWQRCIVLSYSVFVSRPGRELQEGFVPAAALTRVRLDAAPLAAGLARFLARAEGLGVSIHVVDVPHGHEGFELTDPRRESRRRGSRARTGRGRRCGLALTPPRPVVRGARKGIAAGGGL